MSMLPMVLYVTYAYTMLFVGAYALAEDHSVSDNKPCGQTYHLWKYCFFNLILWFFATVSYCVWRGGGEGARARATVLTIFYFAFFMWGLLLWTSLSQTCDDLFNKQYHMLFAFHHISTITNGVFFFLFFLHEAYIGKAVGGDLTIMAEVHHRYNTPYRPPMDILPPSGGVQSPNNHHQGHQSLAQSPPPPAGLPPQLSYEYEKIMQSTSSSSLPNSTP